MTMVSRIWAVICVMGALGLLGLVFGLHYLPHDRAACRTERRSRCEVLFRRLTSSTQTGVIDRAGWQEYEDLCTSEGKRSTTHDQER